MLWTEKLFGVKNRLLRCCILIHSREIRCTKRNDMDVIIEHARADLHALQDGGVNGIILAMNLVSHIREQWIWLRRQPWHMLLEI